MRRAQAFCWRVRVAAVALLLAAPAVSGSGETAIPSVPSQWVTDSAALLSAQTVTDQNARLRAYERATGHQILVYIAPTTGGVPIEDWAVRAFAQWKVGRKGLDDGLVLFIFPRDRALRIEVGYGLEAQVPDARAARIVRDTIAPALRAGQPDSGVTAGIDQILGLIGDASSATGSASADQNNGAALALGPFQLVFIALFVFVFIVIAIRSPWLAVYLLVNMFSGRGGGGGYSGGGRSSDRGRRNGLSGQVRNLPRPR